MGCCPSKSEGNDMPIAAPFSHFSEIELARHPTLGEGIPASEIPNETRPVINTSKMEVDMLSGYTFVNQYLIIKDIGDGASGKVKLVLNTENNSLYALKMVSKLQAKRGLLQGKGRKEEPNSNALLSEINVMKSLQHPNIVLLHEVVIDDPSSDKLLMVLEYVDGGEVMREDMMGPSKTGFSEEVARRHFRDLVQGLEYLHYHNIIHRDIKPGNLLLTQEGRVKLSDFGSARYFPDGDDVVKDSAGTRLFFAPESCIQGNSYSGKKADVYAAGVVLYILIFARAPFVSPVDFELLQKIKDEEPNFDSRSDVSSELIDLLKQLLCKDPELRPGLEEVMDHPWFTDRGHLAEIKSSRFLTLPTDQPISNDSGITPSISGILKQIPNKHPKRFRKGEYVVKEGQVIDGWYLITTGHCEATSSEWDNEMEDDFSTGDMDFYEEEEEDTLTENDRKVLKAWSNANQESSSVMDEGLHKFQSLDQKDILKGIERRPTEKHGHIKQVVETAYQDYQTTSTDKFKLSRNGRLRGPGSVVGLDLSLESMECHQTIRALEEVHALFVEKSALEMILSRTENRLQIRLFVARLQRIEVMRNVVQNLAALHSDVVLLEKLRSVVRHHAQIAGTIEAPETSSLS